MPDFSSTINLNDKSIWRYAYYYPPLLGKFRSSDVPFLTSVVEEDNVYFKREDLNPSGSVKDRGIIAQLAYARASGSSHFVISTSGNAGIAVAYFGEKYGLKVTVFVSPRILPQKFERLRASGCHLEVHERPLAASLRFALENQATHLRQSRDDKALVGYSSLGYELFEKFGEDLSEMNLFFPVSSGATLVGVGQAILRLLADNHLRTWPKFHVVQTEHLHPIISKLQGLSFSGVSPGSLGVASALCALQTPLMDHIIDLVKVSDGSGWVVSEKEILKAWDYLKKQDISTSAEGAVALSGLWQAREKKKLRGKSLCILTGRLYEG